MRCCLVTSNLRHAELLSKLSNLLSVGSEPESDWAQIEDSGALPSWWLWCFIGTPLAILRRGTPGGLLSSIRRCPASKLYPKTSSALLRPTWTIRRDGAPAGRAHLLSLEPALEAAQM